MRSRRSLTLLLAAGVASACSSGSSDLAKSADDRAERAQVVMEREKRGDAVDMVRRVVGGDPSPSVLHSPDPDDASADAIEALEARGDRFEGEIILRITERDNSGELSQGDSTVRCYRYELRDGGVAAPDTIDCPTGPAISVPPAAPKPTIPEDVQTKLDQALRPLVGTDPSSTDVLRVARSVAGRSKVIRTAEDSGSIGVAIGNGEDECVFARLTDTELEVWRVPPVVAQPGELGCSAESAARGEGKDYPH